MALFVEISADCVETDLSEIEIFAGMIALVIIYMQLDDYILCDFADGQLL